MPNSAAKFYCRSFCDQDVSGYTITGDLTPTANVIDRRNNTYAVGDTTGAGDGSEEQITVTFDQEMTIDTIFLKSNFKTFKVYYWEDEATGSTGGGDFIEAASYDSNSSAFLEINISEVTTTIIKIVCTHTMVANDQKKLYRLEITKYLGSLYVEGIDPVEQNQMRENFKNLYGGSVQVIKYPNRGKIKIDLNWENMSTTEYATYSTLKSAFLLDALLVYFYYSDSYDLIDSAALYLVNDSSEKEATPYSSTVSSGVSGIMELREC
jgi:hypothetical protein